MTMRRRRVKPKREANPERDRHKYDRPKPQARVKLFPGKEVLVCWDGDGEWEEAGWWRARAKKKIDSKHWEISWHKDECEGYPPTYVVHVDDIRERT